jgi:hypothetical protein
VGRWRPQFKAVENPVIKAVSEKATIAYKGPEKFSVLLVFRADMPKNTLGEISLMVCDWYEYSIRISKRIGKKAGWWARITNKQGQIEQFGKTKLEYIGGKNWSQCLASLLSLKMFHYHDGMENWSWYEQYRKVHFVHPYAWGERDLPQDLDDPYALNPEVFEIQHDGTKLHFIKPQRFIPKHIPGYMPESEYGLNYGVIVEQPGANHGQQASHVHPTTIKKPEQPESKLTLSSEVLAGEQYAGRTVGDTINPKASDIRKLKKTTYQPLNERAFLPMTAGKPLPEAKPITKLNTVCGSNTFPSYLKKG